MRLPRPPTTKALLSTPALLNPSKSASALASTSTSTSSFSTLSQTPLRHSLKPLVSRQSFPTLHRFTYPANHTHPRTMSTAMAKRLEGKTVLITGASSGIGYSTAKEFARTSPANLKLIVTARRLPALQKLQEEIKAEVGDGVKVLPVQLDVSKPEEITKFVKELPEEFKDVDVLVNNALVDLPFSLFVSFLSSIGLLRLFYAIYPPSHRTISQTNMRTSYLNTAASSKASRKHPTSPSKTSTSCSPRTSRG